MTGAQKWVDLLNQQYSLVDRTRDGRHLLVAMREFVGFLERDPQARRYVQEMNRKWERSYKYWFTSCEALQQQMFDLESEIRKVGARLTDSVQEPADIPNPAELERSRHILSKIEESNWYSSWAHLTDDMNLETLHLEGPPHTRTGHMISRVMGISRTLERLAKALDLEQTTATQLRARAERHWWQYQSAGRRTKNEWISSGAHALDQLKVAVEIMDGEVFVDPENVKHKKVPRFTSWLLLMVRYAPPDLTDAATYWLRETEEAPKEFEEELVPLIRWHVDRVLAELQFLASSRLAHQSLVQRYKARCENYDWKQIRETIQTHVERVDETSAQSETRPRYEFEDMLTLHFARYMHDNGYAVHYTPRDGVHEPDLLSQLPGELEPIVVEAKVVGQPYGTQRGKPWILEGLRAILAYLQKYHSDYGVTDGYLVVFRIGDETFPMFTFDPLEWVISGFTIVPRIINLGRINKGDAPITIKPEDLLESYEGLSQE